MNNTIEINLTVNGLEYDVLRSAICNKMMKLTMLEIESEDYLKSCYKNQHDALAVMLTQIDNVARPEYSHQ